ncbi:AbrB/MazE/SpoVT family DNA-binding domain-containing protein [Turicibacter sanguinis]|uniref:AbrB/MazE/SpoVT family DNA-binding domain-containing protein n=1 Tax=Turicibacter sanguinis TaxID=154288 RepID=UPI0018A8BD59|nr:AbrB/MazE/SpoVT family DNA-binding domain-containing protein [Turicibacter sanguinis]
MERQFDCQGRLTLPAEMRSKLGIKESDNLYIGLSGNVIYISKDKVTDFISRKVDVHGRIAIPIEFKRTLSISDESLVHCELETDLIRITRSDVCCVMCGKMSDVITFKSVRICYSCIKEIKLRKF